jgi:hypothetical protein
MNVLKQANKQKTKGVCSLLEERTTTTTKLGKIKKKYPHISFGSLQFSHYSII